MRGLTARWRFVLPVLLLAASTSHASSDPAIDPQGWLRELDAAKPRADGWKVEKMRVELGPAHLEIEDGWLIGVSGPTAQAQEFLFLGHARFVLSTDDPVESYQIDLFTGHEALDEPVTSAVFALGNDAAAAAIDARPGRAPLDPAVARDASTLLSAWRASREYLRSSLRTDALADAAGDRPAQRFVATWCDAPRLGHFYFEVAPFERESIQVKQFVPLRLGDLDKDSWQQWLRREQGDGRHLETEVDDYGDWNTWYSSPLAGKSGAPSYGHESFEPEHYDLKLALDEPVGTVSGLARVDALARTDGARVVRMTMFPDLTVDAVTLSSGAALPWVRNRRTIVVMLPSQVLTGDKLAVDVRYHGTLFVKTDVGNLLVKQTTNGWYPHVGTVDRATYRASFDPPHGYALLSSGHKLAAEDGRQVWALEKPSGAFGFEIGKYKVVERQLGHVALEIGFLTDQRTASESEREETIATIDGALAAYERTFGPYPLDTLTVATTRHGFAQGFLGFVTLPDNAIQDIDRHDVAALERRRLVAHELAHQWWGNLVGWASDRDVWLSESLANYAAAIYRRDAATKSGETVQSAYLDLDFSEAVLSDYTIADRPLEALGPISLGSRLQSSLSDKAYHEIVYKKGAMVLATLAEQLGEEPLLGMLKEVAQRASFRPIDTDTMFAALGKMSGRDLDPFVRQFIRGVGYPEIYFEYAIEPVENAFAVRGTVRQVAHGYRRDKLVRVGDRGFDVAPTYHIYQPDEQAQATVAALVAVNESKAGSGVVTPWTSALALHGFRTKIAVVGPETPIGLKVAEKPWALHVDPRRMLPARVFDASEHPKGAFIAQAAALRSAGRIDEAKAAYARALATGLDVSSDPQRARSKADLAAANDALDGSIHVALARIALDAGDVEEARKELADKNVREDEILRVRLALRSGDAAGAYKILSKRLALYVEQRETDTVFDAARKTTLASGRGGTGGDYLLYAAAAHATGHEDVCREAMAEAKRHGADASLLEELHASAH